MGNTDDRATVLGHCDDCHRWYTTVLTVADLREMDIQPPCRHWGTGPHRTWDAEQITEAWTRPLDETGPAWDWAAAWAKATAGPFRRAWQHGRFTPEDDA